MIVAGVDPGLRGGIAVAELLKGEGGLVLSRVIDVWDMPTTKDVDGKPCPDPRLLHADLRAHAPDLVVLEWPHARERARDRSPATEWRFAVSCGTALAACQLLSPDPCVVLCSPAAWKRAMRLSADKALSLSAARELVTPDQAKAWFARKGDDGRAEALLLIEHFRRNLSPSGVVKAA